MSSDSTPFNSSFNCALTFQKRIVTICTQCARRTRAAAKAPRVQLCPFAEVTGMRLHADQLNERSPAQRFRKPPVGGFVKPHQSRLHQETPIHAKIQRHLQRLDRVVAAIRISGETRLAHPAEEYLQTTSIRNGGGDCVSTWSEGPRRRDVRDGFLRISGLPRRHDQGAASGVESWHGSAFLGGDATDVA